MAGLSKNLKAKIAKSGGIISESISPSSKTASSGSTKTSNSAVVNYNYDSTKESPEQYNARIAKERGDTAQELASQNATLKGKTDSGGNFTAPTETVAQTVAKSQSMLDQTQAQGDTPYAGSTFEANLLKNPDAPVTPEIPQATDTVTSTVDNPDGTVTNNLASGGTDTGTETMNPDGTMTFNPISSTNGNAPQSSQGTPLTNPSVVDYLNSTGQPSDFAARKAMAEKLGIQGYSGTVEQNQQLLSASRGIPVSPSENVTPTSAGVIADTPASPVATDMAFQSNADKFGLTQTSDDFASDPITTIKNITKQVFDAMGLGDARDEIKSISKDYEDLSNKKDDEIRDINDNPWLTEGVRVKQIQSVENKYEDRLGNMTDKLQLLENVQKDATQQAQFALGTAINLFDSERKFQSDQVQAYYDQAQTEFDNQVKLATLNQKNQGTSEMQEYMFAVQQGFQGDFLGYKQAIAAAGRAPSSEIGGLTPAQINTTVNSIAGAFDNEQIVKDYNTIRRNLDTFNNLGTSATDDIQRVYTFAKVADPNSAVKEGEYASIEKYAQAVAQRAGLQLNRVFTPTGILTPEARKAMGATLQTSLNASQSSYNQVQAEYQRQIDDAYLGKARSITNYTPPASYGPQQSQSQPTNQYQQETQGLEFEDEGILSKIFKGLF